MLIGEVPYEAQQQALDVHACRPLNLAALSNLKCFWLPTESSLCGRSHAADLARLGGSMRVSSKSSDHLAFQFSIFASVGLE